MAGLKTLIYKDLHHKTADFQQLNKNELVHYIRKGGVGYEGIYSKCKGYLDFDLKYENQEQLIFNHFSNILCAVAEVAELFNIKKHRINKDILILDSSGYKKSSKSWVCSFHLIILNKVFNCGLEIKELINGSSINFTNKPDLTIYKDENKRQLFRLLNCSKSGENRPLKMVKLNKRKKTVDYVNIEDVTDEQILNSIVSVENYEPLNTTNKTTKATHELWQLFKNEQPETALNFTPYEIQNEIINTKRLNPSFCDICERIHDNDNTLYLTVKADDEGNKRLFRGCVRDGKKNIYICNLDEKNGAFTKKKTVKLLTNEEINEYKGTLYNDLKEASDEIIFSKNKWVSDNERLMECIRNTDYKGIIAIRSEKGTGKTYTLAEEWKDPKYKNVSIQIVTHRRSLSENMKHTFKNCGFIHYQDTKEQLSINKKNIIVADSLHRLNISNGKNEILVLDEIKDIRTHLVSPTFKNHKKIHRNIEILKFLIKNSNKILIMDANLSNVELGFIREINKTATIELFVNEYVKPESIRCFEEKHNEALKKIIIDELKNGDYEFIPMNTSTDKMDELERYILNKTDLKPEDILNINSRTQQQPKQKAFIEDPDGEIKKNKYRVIMTSPTIQSGVDITTKGIYNIRCFFCNSTNSPFSGDQMTARIRTPANNTILYSYKNTNRRFRPVTSEGWATYYYKNINGIVDKIEDDYMRHFSNDERLLGGEIGDDGIYKITNSFLFKLICNVEAEKEQQIRNWHQLFINRQQIAGHKVILKTEITNNELKKELKIVKAESKQAFIEVKTEKAELINSVRTATEGEMEEFEEMINKNEALTKEQQAMKNKNIILKSYDKLEDVPDDPEWYYTYDDKYKINHYKIQKTIYRCEDFKEALNEIKDTEARKLRGIKETDDFNKKTALLCNEKYLKSAKCGLLFEWLRIFKIESLETQDITENIINNGLKKIHKEYLKGDDLNNTISILGKNKKRCQRFNTLKYTDPKYNRSILDFINGSLYELLGVKIKNSSKSKREALYQLVNEYLDIGTFTINKTDDRPHFINDINNYEFIDDMDDLGEVFI